jgi:septation ring formation regulator EzrA
MSKLSDAADAVKRFAAQHQAILDIGNILGEIGSVEQAKEEADRAYAASSEKLATAQAQLAAAQKDHADLLEKTTKLAEDSNAEAARVVEAARYEAERIVQTAPG